MSERRAVAALSRALQASADAALDWLYPPHCCHCGGHIQVPRARILCRRCYGTLLTRRIEQPFCEACGQPLADGPDVRQRCITCLSVERYFVRARAVFQYAEPVRSVVRSYKFGGDYFLGPRLLRGALRSGWMPGEIERPEAVLPVPLHPRRRRERGYDQALLLARVLARHFRSPLAAGALRRTRYTAQQSNLPMLRRQDNVRGAFVVRRPDRVRGTSLLLVDDVMTTGATADECAKVLSRAGAAQVQVLTLARTGPQA